MFKIEIFPCAEHFNHNTLPSLSDPTLNTHSNKYKLSLGDEIALCFLINLNQIDINFNPIFYFDSKEFNHLVMMKSIKSMTLSIEIV